MNEMTLTITFGKSGTFLINRIVEEIQKQNNIYKNFYNLSGISQFIENFCGEYIHGEFMLDWQQIEFKNEKFRMVLPHPKYQYFKIDLSLLLKNTSLVTSHSNPEVFFRKLNKFKKSKIIYVYRDIRDVLVSWMYFTIKPTLQKRWPEYKHKTISSIMSDSNLIKSQVSNWVSHLESAFALKDNMLLIKYENLVKEKLVNLKLIDNHLGTQSNLEKIIIETSINKMRLESKDHIRKVDTKKKWSDIFNDNQKDIIKQIAGQKIIELDYEKDNDW